MVFVDAVPLAARFYWRDLIALGKPRLSAMVLCTTWVGLALAPGHLAWPRSVLTLLATALVVGAANALNSYLERDSDALMRRTRSRPLPAGRLEPRTALWLAGGGAAMAIGVLYAAANPLTALLAFAAFASYGWLYTPMKRYSSFSVLVGAIPGAIPPLLGYTAVTGRINEAGLSLFAVLFFWQLPHFLAIAVYLKDDYARGGLKVLPLVCTARQTVCCIVFTAALLLPVSLWPYTAGVAGGGYAAAAMLWGAAFLACTLSGFTAPQPGRWARQVFLGSIVYLTLLLVCMLTGAQ